MNDRLKVSFVAKNQPATILPTKNSRRQEIQANLERLWLINPKQFNPERDCIERLRIRRTLEAIKYRTALTGKRVVDLGCGAGVMSRLLRDHGAKVDAVDAATKALQQLQENETGNITPIHDCLPTTRLDDNVYDVVVCTEVIGYLHPNEYRLLFAELARLIKADGLMVCSTALDIKTEDPLERFAMLAETEFMIDQWILSYHKLLIILCAFFEAPAKFIKASRDAELRNKEIAQRRRLGGIWFKFNSGPFMAWGWRLINLIASPIAAILRQNDRVMGILEKVSKFLWSQSGISHAIFVGKRRPLTYPLPPDEIPREQAHKKQMWE